MNWPSILLSAFLLVQAPAGLQKSAAPPARHVIFAQLTDAHIFDDGWKTEGSEPYLEAMDDRAALHWAVDQVNAAADQTPIDFVVYTGDFGVQNVFFSDRKCEGIPFSPQPGLPPFSAELAARELSLELNRLKVHEIFVTQGNNDIIDEKVIDNVRFGCFIAQLQAELQKLSEKIKVEVLRADSAFEVAGFRLAGLNSASFKEVENYEEQCKAGPIGAPKIPKEGCPLPQLQALAATLEKDKSAPLLLFTHVPDLIDPYRKGASWNIDSATRKVWLQLALQSQIVGIFAGHFHSNQRDFYATNVGTHDLFLDADVGRKTWVAPPIAGKNQRDGKPQARGLMLVDISGSQVVPKPVWYPGPIQSQGQPVSKGDATVTATDMCFFWLIAKVIIVSGLFGAGLNFLLERERTDPPGSTAALPKVTGWYKRPELWLSLGKNLFLGVGAAFLVPLFLHVIGSDLLTGKSVARTDPTQLFVIAGFCLVAAMSARSFIKSVSERVLKKAENAEKLAGEAKRETAQAQAVLNTLIEPESNAEQEKLAAGETLGPNERRVLSVFVKPPYALRTMAGILAERGLENTKKTVDDLKARGLVDATSVTGSDGIERMYWHITARGVAALAHLENQSGEDAPALT